MMAAAAAATMTRENRESESIHEARFNLRHGFLDKPGLNRQRGRIESVLQYQTRLHESDSGAILANIN